MRTLLIVAFALAVFATYRTAHAAQDAIVAANEAAIRENPTDTAKIIESKPAGTKIRISSSNKGGWFKTRASTGDYGWIWQADITVLTFHDDVKAANLEFQDKPHDRRTGRHEPWFFMRAGGNLSAILASDLSKRLGLGQGKLFFAPGAFFQMSATLQDKLRAGLRVVTYSHSGDELYQAVLYKIGLSSTPVMIGLDTDVTRGEAFDLSAGIYGGLGFGSNVTVRATNLPAQNGFELSGTDLALMINIATKYHFSRVLSAVGEMGLFYTRVPKGKVPGPFNGDSPFRDADGNLISLQVNHFAPVIGLGIELSF